MTRNNIIDFLYDQSTKRDVMLFAMLKDENFNIPSYEEKSIYKTKEINKMPKSKAEEPKTSPFRNVSKCEKCGNWCEDHYIEIGDGCCSKEAINNNCGHPDYKYFSEKGDKNAKSGL